MTAGYVLELLKNILFTQTGLPHLSIKVVIMLGIALLFLYLAVAKEFEPLLLLPIGFGCLLANMPGSGMIGIVRQMDEMFEHVSRFFAVKVLLVAGFIVVVHHRIVLAEEEHLRGVFGQEYTDYCCRVRRYI